MGFMKRLDRVAGNFAQGLLPGLEAGVQIGQVNAQQKRQAGQDTQRRKDELRTRFANGDEDGAIAAAQAEGHTDLVGELTGRKTKATADLTTQVQGQASGMQAQLNAGNLADPAQRAKTVATAQSVGAKAAGLLPGAEAKLGDGNLTPGQMEPAVKSPGGVMQAGFGADAPITGPDEDPVDHPITTTAASTLQAAKVEPWTPQQKAVRTLKNTARRAGEVPKNAAELTRLENSLDWKSPDIETQIQNYEQGLVKFSNVSESAAKKMAANMENLMLEQRNQYVLTRMNQISEDPEAMRELLLEMPVFGSDEVIATTLVEIAEARLQEKEGKKKLSEKSQAYVEVDRKLSLLTQLGAQDPKLSMEIVEDIATSLETHDPRAAEQIRRGASAIVGRPRELEESLTWVRRMTRDGLNGRAQLAAYAELIGLDVETATDALGTKIITAPGIKSLITDFYTRAGMQDPSTESDSLVENDLNKKLNTDAEKATKLWPQVLQNSPDRQEDFIAKVNAGITGMSDTDKVVFVAALKNRGWEEVGGTLYPPNYEPRASKGNILNTLFSAGTEGLNPAGIERPDHLRAINDREPKSPEVPGEPTRFDEMFNRVGKIPSRLRNVPKGGVSLTPPRSSISDRLRGR